MAHSHPSIQALLDVEGGTDPVAAIRRRACALAAQALALGWEGPPFDMNEIASLRRLRVARSRDLADDQDACVTPGRILLNARKNPVRQRYSIAHEVVHTLFPDYAAEVERKGRLWRRDGDDSEFERLCQVAAAELLFPLEPFRAARARRGVRLAAVLALAADFDASVEATVRRTVETTDKPVVAVFLRPQDPATGAWLEVSPGTEHSVYTPLGVSLVCASNACGVLQIPLHCSPPKRGAADRAWKRVSLTKGTVTIQQVPDEHWSHVGIDGTWASEAMTLPKRAAVPHEVVCLMQRVVT